MKVNELVEKLVNEQIQKLAEENRKDILGNRESEKEDFLVSLVRAVSNRYYGWLEKKAVQTSNSGGYLIPPQLYDELVYLASEREIVRPRGVVITITPGDSVSVPALDQGNGQFGGIVGYWKKEGAEVDPSEPKFKQIVLTAREYVGLTAVSQKWLNSVPEGDTYLRNLFAEAVAYAEDIAYLTGSGEGEPMGIINCPGVHTVNRKTASKVTYEDFLEMESLVAREGLSPIWVISRLAMKSVKQLADANNNLIWVPPTATEPGTIIGYPYVVTDKLPALGNKGDVIFGDFRYYYIGDKKALAIAMSEHARFTKNEVLLRFTIEVDGSPVAPGAFAVLDVPKG